MCCAFLLSAVSAFFTVIRWPNPSLSLSVEDEKFSDRGLREEFGDESVGNHLQVYFLGPIVFSVLPWELISGTRLRPALTPGAGWQWIFACSS